MRDSSDAPTQTTPPGANRDSPGSWTLVALVIANMIGAGVFTTSGFALGDLGSPWTVLLAWLLGGMIALAGAQSYGLLARLMPASGGEYLYLSRTVHPLAGFLAGWVSLLAGFTGAIAMAATTFVVYAAPGLTDSWHGDLLASAMVLACAALHGFMLKPGALVQNLAVAIKLGLILLFCVFALWQGAMHGWHGAAEAGSATPITLPAFAMTLMWISFSYSGFNAAVYLAGEVPQGESVVPRALLTGTLLTMGVYLVLNAIFVLAPDHAAVAHSADVAAIAAATLGGEPLALATRAVIALALFTSVSAMIMAGPRVYARMADDGLLPAALRYRGGVPGIAILAQALLAIAVVWLSGLRELLSWLGFTLGLSAAATVACLFVQVRREPALRHRLDMYPAAPIVFIGSTLLFAALGAMHSPREMIAALATIGSGALLYAIASSGRR